MAATGVYEWKDPKTAIPGAPGAAPKSPTDPMGAPNQGQAPGSLGTTAANRTAAGATPSFGDLLKGGPAASGPSPSFNDLFSGMGDARAQNLEGAQKAISSGFQQQGPSQSGQLARNSLIKAQTEAARQNAEASALSGRDETGQITGDRREYMTKTLLPQRMDFEAQLQAQEEQQAQDRQQKAVGNLIALEGLGEQSRIAAGDLSLREKELAQQGSQFKDELSFKKWATEGGWSQQEADRVWKSMESDKDRTLTASEGALGRELQKYLGDRGFEIDEKKLSETIRQFDGKIAFDTWATQAGLDDNEKGRIWDAHLQDINQKWQTGERLGAQDHQVLIEDKRTKSQLALAEFDKLTQLEVLGKTQDWDKAKMDLANTYQSLRDERQMGHDEAMTVLKGEMETRLTQMGIDAQSARQAAEIEANRWTQEREIAHESALATAELAFKHKDLQGRLGISAQEISLRELEVQNQVEQFHKTLGLEAGKLDLAKHKAAFETQAILMELAGDDPDMVQFASEQFVKMMAREKLIGGQEAELMLKQISGMDPAAAIKQRATDALKSAGTSLMGGF